MITAGPVRSLPAAQLPWWPSPHTAPHCFAETPPLPSPPSPRQGPFPLTPAHTPQPSEHFQVDAAPHGPCFPDALPQPPPDSHAPCSPFSVQQPEEAQNSQRFPLRASDRWVPSVSLFHLQVPCPGAFVTALPLPVAPHPRHVHDLSISDTNKMPRWDCHPRDIPSPWSSAGLCLRVFPDHRKGTTALP